MKHTKTKGNIIIEDIKIGDIHYEFEYGLKIKSKVLTLPKKNDSGQWEWKSVQLDVTINSEIIDYRVDPEYPHYGPNLWDTDKHHKIAKYK